MMKFTRRDVLKTTAGAAAGSLGSRFARLAGLRPGR